MTKVKVSGQNTLPKESESPQLSPVYQSEAAKQIVQELVSPKSECNRRLIPKEKRRHHTVSSSKPLISTNNYTVSLCGSIYERRYGIVYINYLFC